MTGAFSSDWLALREPADQASRDRDLRDELRAILGDRPVRIVDLGCGTGSNLRNLAAHLPRDQTWLLVDNDDALLTRAARTLREWADQSSKEDASLRLHRDGRTIDVIFETSDLAINIAEVVSGADVVTAAAFFDLVSVEAIERLAEAVAKTRSVFYAVLTYDGREEWAPSHPDDVDIHSAFKRHMRRDKGFGPAAGPDAPELLRRAFASRGYHVRTADSAWRLSASDRDLIALFIEGQAQAVTEDGAIPLHRIAAWCAARRNAAAGLVGHQDLLAVPA